MPAHGDCRECADASVETALAAWFCAEPPLARQARVSAISRVSATAPLRTPARIVARRPRRERRLPALARCSLIAETGETGSHGAGPGATPGRWGVAETGETGSHGAGPGATPGRWGVVETGGRAATGPGLGRPRAGGCGGNRRDGQPRGRAWGDPRAGGCGGNRRDRHPRGRAWGDPRAGGVWRKPARSAATGRAWGDPGPVGCGGNRRAALLTDVIGRSAGRDGTIDGPRLIARPGSLCRARSEVACPGSTRAFP